MTSLSRVRIKVCATSTQRHYGYKQIITFHISNRGNRKVTRVYRQLSRQADQK